MSQRMILTTEEIVNNLNFFPYLPEDIRGDKEIALKVVKKDGLMLAHLSEKLRSDPEVIEIAIKQDPNASLFAKRTNEHIVKEITELCIKNGFIGFSNEVFNMEINRFTSKDKKCVITIFTSTNENPLNID